MPSQVRISVGPAGPGFFGEGLPAFRAGSGVSGRLGRSFFGAASEAGDSLGGSVFFSSSARSAGMKTQADRAAMRRVVFMGGRVRGWGGTIPWK
jgi:hypothetical protein